MSVFGPKKLEEHERPAPSGSSAGYPSSIIGRTLYVKGEVIADDDVMIDGHIEGKVTVKKRLTVGRNAHIKSDVDAFAVVIQGKVEGNVRGRSMVEIVPGGILIGNITSPKLIIAEGGYFEGNVEMKGKEDKNLPNAAEKSGHTPVTPAEKDTSLNKPPKK